MTAKGQSQTPHLRVHPAFHLGSKIAKRSFFLIWWNRNGSTKKPQVKCKVQRAWGQADAVQDPAVPAAGPWTGPFSLPGWLFSCLKRRPQSSLTSRVAGGWEEAGQSKEHHPRQCSKSVTGCSPRRPMSNLAPTVSATLLYR